MEGVLVRVKRKIEIMFTIALQHIRTIRIKKSESLKERTHKNQDEIYYYRAVKTNIFQFLDKSNYCFNNHSQFIFKCNN